MYICALFKIIIISHQFYIFMSLKKYLTKIRYVIQILTVHFQNLYTIDIRFNFLTREKSEFYLMTFSPSIYRIEKIRGTRFKVSNIIIEYFYFEKYFRYIFSIYFYFIHNSLIIVMYI